MWKRKYDREESCMHTRVRPYEGNDQPIGNNNPLECKKRRNNAKIFFHGDL